MISFQSFTIVSCLVLLGIVFNPMLVVNGQSNSTDTNSTDGSSGDDSNSTTTIGNFTNPWMDLNDTVYEDCDAFTFYNTLLITESDPTKWDRAAIRNLLTQQHRTTLPTVPESNNDDDIISALIDLFPGTESGTVRLWFRDIDMPSSPALTTESWRRGDVWPLEPNANTSNATTDVHAQRPIDWTVSEDLRDLWFGTCGTVESEELCTTPATPETAADTSQDGKIKVPPESSRGDVARSLFYDAIRYEIELGLQLKDCPPFLTTDYGYLSTLLEWHEADPVDALEYARNDRACSRWQGNRNIFVDYPELVPTMFGTPDTIKVGTNLYSNCIVPTDSPTASPNACSSVRPGDVQIFLFNSNNVPRDDTENASQVVFFPLIDIPADVESLYLTDMGWNGTDFATDEGVLQYNIPEAGIEPGKVFAFGVQLDTDLGSWSEVEGSKPFILSDITGDNIFLYCLNADNKPHFIVGTIYNDAATWKEGPIVTNGTTTEVVVLQYNESVLPEILTDDGNLALPIFPNYLYRGPEAGRRVELVEEFANPANWNGSMEAWIIDTGSTSGSTVLHTAFTTTTWIGMVLMIAGLSTFMSI